VVTRHIGSPAATFERPSEDSIVASQVFFCSCADGDTWHIHILQWFGAVLGAV